MATRKRLRGGGLDRAVASGWRVNNERVDSLKFFVLDTRSVLFRGEWKGELRRIMENEIGRGDRFRGSVK